jgi:hypothetical protein
MLHVACCTRLDTPKQHVQRATGNFVTSSKTHPRDLWSPKVKVTCRQTFDKGPAGCTHPPSYSPNRSQDLSFTLSHRLLVAQQSQSSTWTVTTSQACLPPCPLQPTFAKEGHCDGHITEELSREACHCVDCSYNDSLAATTHHLRHIQGVGKIESA